MNLDYRLYLSGRMREVWRYLRWPAVLILFLLAGCAIGSDYHRPAAVTTMPARYAGATNEWKVATPQAHMPKGAWWEIFNDSELNRLEARAAESNQQLQAAVARFAQARAITDVSRSGLFPQITAGLAAARQKDSANRPVFMTGQAAGTALTHTYNNFSVLFDLSYEVDLWGQVRRQVESAGAEAQANAAELEGVRLEIAAEVAADYFTLRALDSEKMALQSAIEAQRKYLELTRSLHASGFVSELDVAQAETILKTSEAQLPTVILSRAEFEHALAALIGEPASSFKLAEQPLNSEAPVIPPGVPSELLERRPDISAAERRMAEANANIGVAKAAFFPSISFKGLAGFQSVDAGTLFDWPSRLWAVGPSLSMPVFEGGRLTANLRAAKAGYQEAIAQYRNTVLTAFMEVENNLAAQRLLADEYAREQSALQSARKQLGIVTDQYRGGFVSYLDVANAEVTKWNHEQTVARLRGERFVAAVALIKSLGGTWRQDEMSHSK